MGGALALALAKTGNAIAVSNPSSPKLERLRESAPGLLTFNSNAEAARRADIIVVAVKPWVLPDVIKELREQLKRCKAVVSVVAGVEAAELASLIGKGAAPVYYVIPNTAVAVGEGMTFVSTNSTDATLDTMILNLLGSTGKVEMVAPRLMNAGMAIASCGIAYAMRYVRAAVEGGVELGLYPAVATKAVAQTLRGAAALLEARGLHPEEEIDRVTTPGGITIRGLNAMEAAGFSASVIAGIKASKL